MLYDIEKSNKHNLEIVSPLANTITAVLCSHLGPNYSVVL